MKNVKSDTRYIIKRILIGVGIAILLFNLKKCNVYAQSYYFSSSNNTPTMNTSSQLNTSAPCTTSNLSCYYLVGDMQTDTDTYNFYYINRYKAPNDILIFMVQYNDKYYIFAEYFKKNTSTDYTSIKYLNLDVNINSLQFPPNMNAYNSNNELIGNFATSTSLNDWNGNYTTRYSFLEIDLTQNTYQYKNDYTLANNVLSQGTFISKNFDYEIYYNNVRIDSTDPLANYTQVDLTGYEGVLLVPKDYQIMQENFSRTEQPIPGTFITYLDLDFYSEKCIRSTLINLTNVNDLMTNNIGTSVGGLAGSISGTCTDEPFQTILSYRYDMLSGMIPMGIMVYNNEIITGTYNNGFGTSYVWYNPTYYDYYLIESVADFNETISFTDFDGTEKDLHVEKIPNFEEMANYVLEHSEDLDKGKINSILGYSKITIPFLNKLKLYSCEAIRMPFPWSNSIMIMPCMSTLYNNVIPTAMIGVISVIINGLLIYRAIMSIIGTYLDLARPDTTKLEVLDL